VPIEERFWRHVVRTESCWLWTGVHRKSGAGILPVRQAGKVQRLEAARLAWELFVGPLPPGRECGDAAAGPPVYAPITLCSAVAANHARASAPNLK